MADASYASPPPGFVFNPDYGDYEDPNTGSWWSPETGQVYSADAPAADGGPSANYSSGAGGGAGALGTGYLIKEGLSGGPATEAAAPGATAVTASGAPAASAVAPSATESALGIGGAAPTVAANGATTFASAEAAQAAGYEAVGTAADGGVIAVPASAGASPALAYAGIPAGLYTGYKQFQGIKDLASGKKPGLISSAALLPFDGGASLASKALEKVGIHVPFGHSKNYYAGKDRASALNEISGGTGTISFRGPDGKQIDITADQFRKDPNTYNYDLNSDSNQFDIGTSNGLTYLLTGIKPGEKKFTDISGMYANLHKQGVSAKDLYGQYGLDYDTAMQAIGNDPNLSQEEKTYLQTGINMGFGKAGYDKNGKPKNQPASSTAPKPAAPAANAPAIMKDPPRKPPAQQATKPSAAMIPRAIGWDQVRSRISGQKPTQAPNGGFGKIPVFR